MHVGFIGLGQLGLPMAQNLLEAGHTLTVYNRTASKADALVAGGARLAREPKEVVARGGIVVSVLWDEDSVRGIIESPGFLDTLGPDGVHISVSTIGPEAAPRLAALHVAHGSHYVEAPVFGRPDAAVAKKLFFPIAGASQAKARARPLLEAMGAQAIYDFGATVGPAGAVKLVGNFLIGSAARSLAEAVALGEKNGVDPHALVQMLTSSLFPAPIYQSYGKMIADKTVVPLGASGIMGKDMGLLRASAARSGVVMPMAERLVESLTKR
jgi:3-hydroxyisobutyrate dehydrogenase-like beta-hydroxyacid dehydrogenase